MDVEVYWRDGKGRWQLKLEAGSEPTPNRVLLHELSHEVIVDDPAVLSSLERSSNAFSDFSILLNENTILSTFQYQSITKRNTRKEIAQAMIQMNRNV